MIGSNNESEAIPESEAGSRIEPGLDLIAAGLVDRVSIQRMLILGTGLLGSSTGLALRAAGFRGTMLGWDKDPTQAQVALERKAIDGVAQDPLSAALEVQVIVLATPVYAILDWMERLAPVLGPDHLVTDLGSTKTVITEAAGRLFAYTGKGPGRAFFLPGHPMAGKETGGAAQGDSRLFQNAMWIFTPQMDAIEGPDAGPHAEAMESAAIAETQGGEGRALAAEWRGWVEAFGCRTMDLDARRHDELVAWVSHLPQFLSTALSALLEEEVGDAPELASVGGRALAEMTRLGSSSWSMWRDVAMTNTIAIAASIHALEQRLAHLRENLRTPALREEFEQANRFRAAASRPRPGR